MKMAVEANDTPEPGLVSIIVPAYNAERFLADTLETAFAHRRRIY
jgi:glycosyltransferase involved in cell wall biosynthesis